MKRLDDLTPQSLKMTQQEREHTTCVYCGMSLIHAVERHGALYCGNCSRPWKSVEDARRERQNNLPE